MTSQCLLLKQLVRVVGFFKLMIRRFYCISKLNIFIQSESEMIGVPEDNENLYFMRQTVGNACGTVGIIHALANSRSQIPLDGTVYS